MFNLMHLKFIIVKTHYIVLSLLFVFAALFTVHGQKGVPGSIKKENIQVWGECGMCKKKIEKAAENAGAATAAWDEDSKMLSVSYNRYKTSDTKIQQAIAAAGYDTKDVTAGDEAYNKLPACCHYERKEAVAKQAAVNSCDNGMACSRDTSCCKDGKCDKTSNTCRDITACKEKGCCKS